MTSLSVATTLSKHPFTGTKGTAALAEMKNAVLGKRFFVSVVFIGERRSRTLNKHYRAKDRSTNVLTFPLSKNEGEIFINVTRAQKEARELGVSEKKRIAHLFIHGLLHLKGFKHGSRMESEEERLLAKSGF